MIFVHLARHPSDDADNPLAELSAFQHFQHFQQDNDYRCEEDPS